MRYLSIDYPNMVALIMLHPEIDISVTHNHVDFICPPKSLYADRYYEEVPEFAATWENTFYEEIEGTIHHGSIFDTNKGAWLVVPPPPGHLLSMQEVPYILNGAGSALEARQNPGRTYDDNDRTHNNQVQFFAANWNKLVDIFYSEPVSVSESLQQFTEVELLDFDTRNALDPERDRYGNPKRRNAGKADFIGEGPDGQLIIVEFKRKPSKNLMQVVRQAVSVDALVKKTNADGKKPKIATFMGKYEKNGDLNTVTLLHRPFTIPKQTDTENISMAAD